MLSKQLLPLPHWNIPEPWRYHRGTSPVEVPQTAEENPLLDFQQQGTLVPNSAEAALDLELEHSLKIDPTLSDSDLMQLSQAPF
jgi:hypothetical protein